MDVSNKTHPQVALPALRTHDKIDCYGTTSAISWGVANISQKSTHNAPARFLTGTRTGTLLTIGICALLLILVENYPINHHVLADAVESR